MSDGESVLTCGELDRSAMAELLARFGLELAWADDGEPTPGSHWGAPEAGLVGKTVWVRRDTPVHSLLHEACHLICMDPTRRAVLDTDAGGDDLEESAVCYLQLLLADHLPGASFERISADMDLWGYSFRLGSTLAWTHHDAEDARAWLVQHGLLDDAGRPAWRLRSF